MLHNDQGINPRGRHKTCNYLCPQHRNTQIHKKNTDKKGETDSNTVTVEDFNTPLTAMDRSSKQKINKETQDLRDTLDQMDLTHIFRTFHPKEEEYTFFSSAHETFSRIDHILGHKSSFSKFKKIEIVSSLFSDHNTMKLDINYRKKKLQKNTNIWRLNNKQYISK